jgi:hypothetical protein
MYLYRWTVPLAKDSRAKLSELESGTSSSASVAQKRWKTVI